MMTALATVTSVSSVFSGYKVELSCQRQSSCRHCSSSESCGTGIVSKALDKKSVYWTLNTEKAVEKGQVVEIGFPEKRLLKSAFLVYMFPLSMLIFGAFVGQFFSHQYFNNNELIIILVSCLSVWLSIYLAKFFAKNLEKRSGDEVVLVRILGEPLVRSL